MDSKSTPVLFGYKYIIVEHAVKQEMSEFQMAQGG